MGPSLQNKFWAVLVRARFHPVALTGDIEQAFLQVQIQEQDRCHEISLDYGLAIQTSGNTEIHESSVWFGTILVSSWGSYQTTPGSLPYRVSAEINREESIRHDLISSGSTVKATCEVKAGATHVFNQASFKLHKWHLNVPAVESPGESLSKDTTFTKEQLGAPQEGEGIYSRASTEQATRYH